MPQMVNKESTYNAGDLGSIPGLGRSPGGKGMATHSSILAWRIPMDRGAWWDTVHGVTESDTTERLTHIVDLQFTMFRVYSKVNHFYTYIYSLFFGFSFLIGHYRVLSRFPYAIQ